MAATPASGNWHQLQRGGAGCVLFALKPAAPAERALEPTPTASA